MSEKANTTPSRREASDQQVTDFLYSNKGNMITAGIVILLAISFILNVIL